MSWCQCQKKLHSQRKMFNRLGRYALLAVLVIAIVLLGQRVKVLESKINNLESTIFFLLLDKAKDLPSDEVLIYDKI